MSDELLHLLTQRATPIRDTIERTQFAPEPKAIPRPEPTTSIPPKPIDPYLASLIGGLADTASTYTFLKRGTGREDNALASGLAQKSPALLTGLGAAANVAFPYILKNTLGKKFPRVARAIAANQGALQMGYGALNTQNTLTPGRVADPIGSRRTSDRYGDVIMSQVRGDK